MHLLNCRMAEQNYENKYTDLEFLLIILIKTIQGKEESDRTFTKYDKKANDSIHNLTTNI
jgi:hypothetical protein